MKKDSFTFSDKLKKSKTLPLSKRIPSRVGGEVKAKRTFFERAQRDLPFIIVAALALLLLPFLSRESGDIDTPSVVWGDGGDTYLEDFNLPKSAEGEIALSSYRNPLDLIVKQGDGESSAKDTIDTYGEDGESSSSGEYSRSSYNEEEYSTAPATSRYGKTVKRSIRNSINRVATPIGSLRTGSMASPSGNSGVGHSMAFGSRARDAAPKALGPGIRPVALQPLTAAGKGRDLTGGDALYAEAARSIGAMNTPGAKNALMEAQLKDVDGKPLGETKSAGAAAAAGKPGAGGGPSNSWGHTAVKPWWWDMMKERSQMRWMLWHYNWEKMLSDNLIKWTSNLASCLIMGSQNGDASKFLGSAGGGVDVCCLTASGEEICAGDLTDYTSSTTGMGKDKETTNHAVDALKMICPVGAEIYPTHAPRKSALDVRLRCLGLKLSELKDKFETKNNIICDGMYSDPMHINISVTRNRKTQYKAFEEIGYYVVGEKTSSSNQPLWWNLGEGPKTEEQQQAVEQQNSNSQQCVLFISKAKPGKNPIPKELENSVKKVVVYKVGDYGSQFYPEGNEDPTFDRDLADYKNKKDEYNSSEEIYWESGDYDNAFNIVKHKIASGCLTEKELQETLKPLGKWRTRANAKRWYNELAICSGDYLKGVKFNPVLMAPGDSINSSDVYMEDCRKQQVFITSVPSNHKFSTTIMNPGARTIAFVLEKVQGNTSNGIDKEGHTEGYVVKKKIDFSADGNQWLVKDNKDGSYTFVADVEVGTTVSTVNDTFPEGQARPGEGVIIWVTTNNMSFVGAKERDVIVQPNASAVFNYVGRRDVTCKYRWGCDPGGPCKAFGQNNPADLYCMYKNDKGETLPYPCQNVEGKYIRTSQTPAYNAKGTAYPDCTPICAKKAQALGLGMPQNPDDIDIFAGPRTMPKQPVLEAIGGLPNVGDIEPDPLCPFCNPNGNTDGDGDGICYMDINGVIKVYPSTSFVGADGTTYYIRISEQETTGNAKYACTPICAAKAKALGITIFETEGPNSPAPIGDALTNNQSDISPVEPGNKKLCPFCDPDPSDGSNNDVNLEPRASCPLNPVKIKENGPCSVIIPGETFFANAWYKICETAILERDLEWVYDYMKDCKDIKIEGHASKTMEAGYEPPYNREQAKERNNIRLGFDRAVEVSKKLRTTWENHGETVSIDLSDKYQEKYDNSVDPSNLGAIRDTNYTGSRSNQRYFSLPERRATISQPTKANATATFKIISYGSSQNTTGPRPKPYSQMTSSERKDWLEKEKVDRKVVLRGTPISN